MAEPLNKDLIMQQDKHFMRLALGYAEQAMAEHEVPVGAVVVLDEQVVGCGWNQPITQCDPSAHAEMQALRDAAQRLGNYRLPQTTLYVTIEPCVMCLGALMHARVARLVYAAPEPKGGAISSQLQLLQSAHWNHQISVTAGVLEDSASALIKTFFKQQRERRRALKDKGGDRPA